MRTKYNVISSPPATSYIYKYRFVVNVQNWRQTSHGNRSYNYGKFQTENGIRRVTCVCVCVCVFVQINAQNKQTQAAKAWATR
jgi:hypothetical protein